MKIQFWSIGKAHDDYVRDGILEFTKRISKYYPVDWRIIAAARQTVNSLEADIRKTESASVLGALQKDDFLVLLDEKGKLISSPKLASNIEQWTNNGVRHLIFLIGGAFGVDESIRTRANYTWALSPLVFPHQLVRLIIAEQVYRACTILRNEKYHHE